jgi:hypothetical protein
MATKLVFTPINTDPAKSSQESFAKRLYWSYWPVAMWSPSMYTASSSSPYNNLGVMFYRNNLAINNLDKEDLSRYTRSLVN